MKIFGYILAAAILAIALPAQAGKGFGLVRYIDVAANGTIMITVDSHPDAPACSTTVNSFAFNGTTPEGKNKYALILAAANAKKTVTVVGSGNCEIWGDRETASYIQVPFN